MLRPEPARWFEALVPHADSVAALEALAATGAIELEVQREARALAPMAELRDLLEAYGALAQRYAAYWPVPDPQSRLQSAPPAERMKRALGAMQAYAREADPHVAALQALERERAELKVWQALLAQFAGRALDFGRLRAERFALERRVVLFSGPAALGAPAPLLAIPFVLDGQAGAILIGPREALDDYQLQAAVHKGRRLPLPGELCGDAERSSRALAGRLAALDTEQAALRERLAALAARHGVAAQLREVERLSWFAGAAPALAASEHFVSITGWTDDASGERLERALVRARVRGVVHLPRPPAGSEPPLVLRNPAWARPFEVFANALGVPGRDEADPSRLLAVVVPLIFGYMFGDIGQGLVLVAAGFALRRRWPVAGVLVAGGAVSMVFGVLFGSVFGQDRWFAPLWLHPLAEPLQVLVVPLVGGALLLASGLALKALQAHWTRGLREWLARDAGVALAYLGLVTAFAFRPAAWLCALGAAWQLLGWLWSERRAVAMREAAAGFLEQMFQLAVNTLSFVRVGAFALAHAGLSAAVNALAAGLPPAGALPVLVLGNAAVIAIEVLLVSVQTTRLVLFEFFIRFLRGSGRPFRPLAHPPSITTGRTT